MYSLAALLTFLAVTALVALAVILPFVVYVHLYDRRPRVHRATYRRR